MSRHRGRKLLQILLIRLAEYVVFPSKENASLARPATFSFTPTGNAHEASEFAIHAVETPPPCDSYQEDSSGPYCDPTVAIHLGAGRKRRRHDSGAQPAKRNGAALRKWVSTLRRAGYF